MQQRFHIRLNQTQRFTRAHAIQIGHMPVCDAVLPRREPITHKRRVFVRIQRDDARGSLQVGFDQAFGMGRVGRDGVSVGRKRSIATRATGPGLNGLGSNPREMACQLSVVGLVALNSNLA